MDDRLSYAQLREVRNEVEPLIERKVDELRWKLERERNERISKVFFGVWIAFMVAVYTFFIVVIATSEKAG